MTRSTTKAHSGKASLRGVFHQHAAVAAITAGIMLIVHSQSGKPRIASVIYVVSLSIMLSLSALYHRPTWSPTKRALMRRLDHAGIYLIIAGTYTPLCLLGMDENISQRILIMVWSGATVGILRCLLVRSEGFAQKTMSALLYVALGWVILPYAGHMVESLGRINAALLVAGGVIYSLGAIVYALKRPDPMPATLGYHEVFHAAVILAAVLHFVVVHSVVTKQTPG